MELSLTPELEIFVRQQVESGHFTSPSEVILTAIKSYKELEDIYKGRHESLRNEIAIGLEASERGEVLTEEEVFDNLRHKLKQRRAQAD